MIDYNTSSPVEHQLNHHHAPQHLGYHPNPAPGANHATPDNYFTYNNTDTSNAAMRSNFPLNAPPLAALHSMAGSEMKTSPAVTSHALAGYNPAAYYSMKNYLNGTPHGITDILSRPDLQALQARLGQGMYYNSCSQASTPGMSPTQKEGPRHLYWPANGQETPPHGHQAEWPNKQAYTGMILPDGGGKDSKKKNTRPTFSGSQIFALEKTFEQQKYLAGPERGRLAYALGMSEGQVKVWFQNRRTKWRKRHAAEMSTKRRADSSSSTNASSSPFEQAPVKQSLMSHQEFNPNMSADINASALHM